MRKFRRILDIGLPILGILVVFGAVLWPVISLRLQLQVLVVLVGILMIEAGVWKLTSPFLPSERKYNALRSEVDRFIDLVRALNSAALESEDNWPPIYNWSRLREKVVQLRIIRRIRYTQEFIFMPVHIEETGHGCHPLLLKSSGFSRMGCLTYFS